MTTWGWSTCGPPPPWLVPPGAGGPPPGSGPRRPAPAEGFASASILREWIAAGRRDLADCFLPAPWPEELEPTSLSHLERALLARVRSLSQAEWALLPDSGVEEGLPARLVQAGSRALSVEEFLTLAKTKRYSHARLRRLLLWAFLGLTAADRPAAPPYLRVLGFTPRGQELLRAMKGAASLPILTKPAHARSWHGRVADSSSWRPAAPTCTACVSPLPAPADWSGPPAPS